MMMTAFSPQNNRNPLVRLPITGAMAQPRSVTPPVVQEPLALEPAYIPTYPADVFVPQAQYAPEASQQTPTYPVPEAYPSPIQPSILQPNTPDTASSAVPLADYTPIAQAEEAPYPDYSATTYPPPAYPSYEATYPTATPTTPAATKPAKPAKHPIGIFEKLMWGTLATVVTGATALAVFENRERLFQSFPTNIISQTKGFFKNLWQGIDGKVVASPPAIAQQLETTNLNRVLSHLLEDTSLSVPIKTALQELLAKTTTTAAQPTAGIDHTALVAILNSHDTLKTKVNRQLELMGVVAAERDTPEKQAIAFLEKFSGVEHPFDSVLEGFSSKEALEKQRYFPPKVIELIEQFKLQLKSSPERRTELMTFLNQFTAVMETSLKKFDKAYKGNTKVTPEQQAALREALSIKLWENPNNAKAAQAEALAKASFWGRIRPAWMPF